MSSAGHAPDTSVTLLGKLSEFPPNQNAWKDFVAIYGFHLFQWCKRYGLQNADAEDVTQLTLLRLSRAMRSFDYNPQKSFRAWLRTVAHHVWQDFAKSKKNTILKHAVGQHQLFTLEAEREFSFSIESAYQEEMLKKSLDNVRLRVLPQTWEAFRLTTYDQIPSQEAADRLGMNLSSIYKAKSNVLKLLQEEIRHLEERLQ